MRTKNEIQHSEQNVTSDVATIHASTGHCVLFSTTFTLDHEENGCKYYPLWHVSPVEAAFFSFPLGSSIKEVGVLSLLLTRTMVLLYLHNVLAPCSRPREHKQLRVAYSFL
jgi:hypothetical protein